jgi:hypothetical protein
MKRTLRYLLMAGVVIASSLSCGGGGSSSLLPGKTIGGAGDDIGRSIRQTSDGGFIIAGSTDSFGAGRSDVYLLKTDSLGNPLWEKAFGGAGDDHGYSVQQTSDGGFIIAGSTNSLGAGANDVYLIKTDPSGISQWEKAFGGAGDDFGYSVQPTADGYVVAGTRPGADGEPDAYLLKTDPSGSVLWEKSYGGPIEGLAGTVNNWTVEGYSVRQTTDGGYILAGRAESLLVAAGIPLLGLLGFDVYLVKTDPDGNKLWETTIGGAGDQRGNSVIQTSDGGYIVAGTSDVEGVLVSAYLVKTDASGSPAWEETFGADGSDAGNSVQQTTDGGYIVTGVKAANNGDLYLIKTDASGKAVWEKTFGANGSDSGSAVELTSDGGYVIVGATSSVPPEKGGSDVYFLKTDADGTAQ